MKHEICAASIWQSSFYTGPREEGMATKVPLDPPSEIKVINEGTLFYIDLRFPAFVKYNS